MATHEERHEEQVARGWISAWRRDDGVWGVSWHPYQGDPDYPGVTYTGTNSLRPGDMHLHVGRSGAT
jgi:hypothetical protein